MSEPVQYLAEATYRPYWLKDGALESTLETVMSKRAELEAIAEALSGASRFYLVGSGGSYSVQHPIRYAAEKHTDLPVKCFSGWEFLDMGPSAVDEDAACIFISNTGTTKEVLKGLEWASERGAATMSLTRSADSKMGRAAQHSFGYEGNAVTIGKMTSLYLLFGSILRGRGNPFGERMIEIAEGLPKLLPSMIPRAKESARPVGLGLKDEAEMLIVGGGVNWGLAYQFAVCTLQEMCWVHATPVDFSEWRHGPLEIFTPGSTAVFLRGRGAQRENEENIIEWCRGNGVNCVVYDSQGKDGDILETPFTLFVELEWLGYYLSLAKNRDMEKWRHYDKVAF
ncbi:SIS domain-containing protein [Candidatus Bathyarchaeota archaeon]|nr:SIS domain-containing protein [Candidatus Bathyarchaeota archaeon]MBL7079317.1 SIS domain-containing protein [Candidatus Bathyarchaeota archaeon]